jgi:hypothetical protein
MTGMLRRTFKETSQNFFNFHFTFPKEESFEAFTGVIFELVVVWIVTPCVLVERYQLSEKHAASIFMVEIRQYSG